MKAKSSEREIFKYIIYGLVLLSLILLITLNKTLRAAALIFIFILINMALSSYKRFLKFPIEIEFLTFGIVVSTSLYGLKAGLVIAILGGILSFFVGYNISPFSFPMLIGYILMAIASSIMQGQNLLFIGIAASLLNNLFVFLVYHFFYGYDVTKNLCFGISNLAFNLILFINILPLVQKIGIG